MKFPDEKDEVTALRINKVAERTNSVEERISRSGEFWFRRGQDRWIHREVNGRKQFSSRGETERSWNESAREKSSKGIDLAKMDRKTINEEFHNFWREFESE